MPVICQKGVNIFFFYSQISQFFTDFLLFTGWEQEIGQESPFLFTWVFPLPGMEHFPDGFNGCLGLGIIFYVVFYPFAGIENGGMVLPLEAVPKGGIGFMQLVSAEVHGNLPGNDDFLGPSVAKEFILLYPIVFADRVDDEIHGEFLAAVDGNLVFQRFPGKGKGNGFLLDMGEGDQFIEGPFQFTDIGIDVAGNVVHHILGQGDAHFFRPFLQDDTADFIIRR